MFGCVVYYFELENHPKCLKMAVPITDVGLKLVILFLNLFIFLFSSTQVSLLPYYYDVSKLEKMCFGGNTH